MNIEEIDIPALLFDSDYRSIEFVTDRSLLTNKLGLKKGIVLGNFIIDSSGRLFKTTKARKLKNYYPFWKFEFFNPLIYIELEVEKIQERIDLDELKNKVLKIISRDEDNWINEGNVNTIKTSIEKSKTYYELIHNIFGNYNK